MGSIHRDVTRLYWQLLGLGSGESQPHTQEDRAEHKAEHKFIIVKSFLPLEQQLPLSWQERTGNQVNMLHSL